MFGANYFGQSYFAQAYPIYGLAVNNALISLSFGSPVLTQNFTIVVAGIALSLSYDNAIVVVTLVWNKVSSTRADWASLGKNGADWSPKSKQEADWAKGVAPVQTDWAKKNTNNADWSKSP